MERFLVERLEVENLGPFEGRHVFDFGVPGDNRSTIVVGNNGSGKTMLFRTLCWLLGQRLSYTEERLFSGDMLDHHGRGGVFEFSATVTLRYGDAVETRSGRRGDTFGPIDLPGGVSVIDDWMHRPYEDEFLAGGGHGSGALILHALERIITAASEERIPPILFVEDVLGRLVIEQIGEAYRLLSNYPGQVIKFAGTSIHFAKPGVPSVLDEWRRIDLASPTF